MSAMREREGHAGAGWVWGVVAQEPGGATLDTQKAGCPLAQEPSLHSLLRFPAPAQPSGRGPARHLGLPEGKVCAGPRLVPFSCVTRAQWLNLSELFPS